MQKYVINGKFMGEHMQGIVRYARELVCALDGICEGMDITLLLPENIEEELPLSNIKCIRYGQHSGMIWEQTDLARYMRKHKDSICINLCNIAPILAPPGITVVHDIMYKIFPNNYTTARNRISRYWHILQYWYIFRKEKKIITVSNFSKGEIENVYPYVKEKISVVPNGWQHVLEYKENTEWQHTYPFLKDKEFYFSLSTLSKNKNGKWIVEVAKRNPEAVFAIGGKYYETENCIIPENVHMLGFISDEDACALIKHCKAFIHPAVYEGFGIPPLEALALGADVISSNTASLPEVLGDSVHYIDPYEYDIDINKILDEPVSDRFEALDKFSWEKSAEALLQCLEQE